jgi:hypothetical protein
MHIFKRLILCTLAFLSLNPSASSADVTHVEQDDPAVAYSGNWYANTSNEHSGGTAALTNTRGARATLSFTGTGITWNGVADGWAGLATVFVDGRMTVVDSYAATGAYQRALYAVHGLPAGPHTLTIEVTHERAAHTDGSWVWIDSFDIEDGRPLAGGITAGTGRIEEYHPALVYTGRWYSNSNAAHSGGTAVLAMDAGSRVSVTFNGTGVRWLAYRDEWSGIARVYLDGELKTTIDNYLVPARAQTVPYALDGLAAGTHTLTIEATGTRQASATGAWVWVDGFDVTP